MPSVSGSAASSMSASIRQRWQEADPLLPAPEPLPPGCGAPLAVTGDGGQLAAAGSCEHWVGTAGSMDTAWGTARRFQLTTAVAGPDVGARLDDLLSLWRDHLAGTPGTGDDDSSAVVTWPSRDIGGVAALVRHGLSPLAVVAARTTRRPPAGPADRPLGPGGTAVESARVESAAVAASLDGGTAGQGVAIRRAGPADMDAVVRLGLEVVRFDAHFGNGGVRPGTTRAVRGEAAALLAGPEAWTWLAERDGEPVGLLSAQRPEAAGWIAPMVRPGTAAYLMLAFVEPGERGTGLGAEMVAQLHRDVGAARVPVTLLHYQLLNPLSAPFWSQQGYRPLWTTWEARPARAIR